MGNMTNYADTRANFVLDIPEQYNFVRDVMHVRALETPDKVGLIGIEPDGTTINRYTFAEITDLTHRTAHLLRNNGVQRGDKVFVQLPRIVEWYATILGCMQIGAVPMPATTQLMGKDQKYRIDRSGAVAAVCDSDGAERFDTVRADCPSIDTAIVVG